MRKLSIKRKWSIIECGSKIQLFVECAQEESNVSIDGKFFKEFKFANGKTVETQIANDSVTVIVTSSTMEARYTIPEGENDAALLAAPKYAPMQGNPFIISEIK